MIADRAMIGATIVPTQTRRAQMRSKRVDSPMLKSVPA